MEFTAFVMKAFEGDTSDTETPAFIHSFITPLQNMGIDEKSTFAPTVHIDLHCLLIGSIGRHWINLSKRKSISLRINFQI